MTEETRAVGDDLERLAIYARVSTPDQDPSGQINRLTRWANLHGYKVTETHKEVASGRDPNRPKQERIMAACRGHHVHAVAVVKIDRWARSMQHLSKTTDELLGLGIAFHAIDQGLHIRPNDPTSKLFSRILGSVAEWEADLISHRTKEALDEKRRKGESLGRPSQPCFVCGASRCGAVYAKVFGDRQPVCDVCKNRPPEQRRQIVRQRESEP